MKISWLIRIYTTNEGWASLPHNYKMDIVYIYGDLHQKKLLNEIQNSLGKDTIRSLLLLIEQNIFHCTESLLSIPLWYNSRMIPRKMTTWINKGVTTIGDILDKNGDILSIEDIQSTWHVTCNFLLHLSLKKKIQLIITQKK